MGKRLIENTFDARKDNRTYNDAGKSKGELDDYPVRKYIATKEGTVTKVPVNNNDIVNKVYVDGNFVPYIGATQDVDLGNNELIVLSAKIDTFSETDFGDIGVFNSLVFSGVGRDITGLTDLQMIGTIDLGVNTINDTGWIGNMEIDGNLTVTNDLTIGDGSSNTMTINFDGVSRDASIVMNTLVSPARLELGAEDLYLSSGHIGQGSIGTPTSGAMFQQLEFTGDASW